MWFVMMTVNLVLFLYFVNQRRTYHTMTKWKRTNNDQHNTTQKTVIQQHKPPQEPGVNTCALVGSAISAPLVTPVVILLNDSNTKNINKPLQNMGLMTNHNCFTRKSQQTLGIFAACYLTHINRYGSSIRIFFVIW